MWYVKKDVVSWLYKPIVVLVLLLVFSSTASAEWKSFSVSGTTGTANTWLVNKYGAYYGDSAQGVLTSMYFQEIRGRGWSTNGGPHVVSEVYSSAYGVTGLNMPGDGPTKGSPGYVTTRHYFLPNPFASPTVEYTSHDGAHSTGSCFSYGC